MAGDLISIQGSGFGTSPQVRYAFNDANWVTLTPLTSSAQVALVQFPASLSRLPDLIAIQVSADGANWSSSVYVNQAKALSFDTNQIGSGSSFRTFGRNLYFSRTPTVRLVDSADGSSHTASVNTGSSNSYALSATAPSDIQSGHTYSVYVSNGYSGNGGSGSETLAPGTLAGRSAGGDYWNLGVPWAADLNYTSNVYNIQNDSRLLLHANGSGTVGDFAAINAAAAIAGAAGGGIVYLPAGSYNLYFGNGCGITMPPRVAVMGGGVSNTFLNYGYGTAPSAGSGGYAACLGSSQSGISDITINNVNQSGNWPQSLIGLNGSETFLQRTKWNIGTAQWLVLQNSTNMTVQNSSIIQGLDPSYNGPLNVQGASNFVLRGNTIQYVSGELDFDQTTNAVFENNTVIRDASQNAPSWIITHVITGNFANGFMLLNNSFNVIGGTLPQTNSGETIGSESGGAIRYDEFRGTVQSASSSSVTDNSQNFFYSSNNAVPNLRAGATLAIVSGQGAGQWATVTGISSDGHTAYVNKPWAVTPTSGSAYATFDWGAANWIIAGNNLSNNEKGIEFFNSSIRDILISGNTLTNDGQILLSPTEQPSGSGLFNIVVNTQVLGNTVVNNNGLRPAAISAVPREDGQYSNFGTAFIGLEIRGNSITGTVPNTLYSNTSLDDSKALSEGINLYWQWQTIANFSDNGTPSMLGTVAQGNYLTNSAVGFELNSGDYQTALYGNVTTNVGTLKADVVLPGILHASVGTVIPTATASIVVSNGSNAAAGSMTVFSQSDVWTSEPLTGSTPSIIDFGASGGTPVPGDYDGDGLVDCAVYRNGSFLVRPSSNPNVTFNYYFANWDDIAVPGDYDGDGKTDIAIFRPSTGQWFYSPSSRPGSPNVLVQTSALNTDIPLPGDYDGDGKTDFGYFRPSTGTFYSMTSSNMGVIYKSPFSLPTDVPVPGDYDGDGITDLAVYRPSTGVWYYRLSTHTQTILSQASPSQPGDVPVPGDYDADGKTDFAIWRPSTQTWYVILSSNPGVTITLPMTGLSGTVTPLSLTPGTQSAKPSLAR